MNKYFILPALCLVFLLSGCAGKKGETPSAGETQKAEIYTESAEAVSEETAAETSVIPSSSATGEESEQHAAYQQDPAETPAQSLPDESDAADAVGSPAEGLLDVDDGMGWG